MPLNRWQTGSILFTRDHILNVITKLLLEKLRAGTFQQIGAVAERDPICVSLSVGTYLTVIVRYLTLFYHTPEISYTPI